MEIIHKDEKYREYLKKIQSAKMEVSKNMSRRSLEEKVDHVHYALKNDTDSQEYIGAMWMLSIPLLVVLIFSYIDFGGYFRLLPVLLVVMFFIYFRIMMNGLKKTTSNLKQELESTEFGGVYLAAKIKYISQGISVKLQRIKMVRSFYALFFPVFITLLVQIVKGDHIFGNFWVSLLVSYIICGTFWWLYFVGDIDDLEFTVADFKDDLAQLVSGNS